MDAAIWIASGITLLVMFLVEGGPLTEEIPDDVEVDEEDIHHWP